MGGKKAENHITEHIPQKKLVLWEQGKIRGEEEEKFLLHLKKCDECMERWINHMEGNNIRVPANLKEGIMERVENEKQNKKHKKRRIFIPASIAAAAALAIIILPNTSPNVARAMGNVPVLGGIVEAVTFREYSYEDGKNKADVNVPKIVFTTDTDHDSRIVVTTEGEDGQPESIVIAEGSQDEQVESIVIAEGSQDGQPEDIITQDEGAADADFKDTDRDSRISKTAEEINKEIENITDKLIKEFEDNLKMDGYQSVHVDSEVLCTTGDYFTLRLNCEQIMGSGAQWQYFYTIDLNTGERLALSDLFKEGSDYKRAVSEDIKRQMKEQMESDEGKIYWVDDPEVGEWNFEEIKEDVSFYLNENGKLVICFNEGDVAPMYMGCVQFIISDGALEGMWKDR